VTVGADHFFWPVAGGGADLFFLARGGLVVGFWPEAVGDDLNTLD